MKVNAQRVQTRLFYSVDVAIQVAKYPALIYLKCMTTYCVRRNVIRSYRADDTVVVLYAALLLLTAAPWSAVGRFLVRRTVVRNSATRDTVHRVPASVLKSYHANAVVRSYCRLYVAVLALRHARRPA